jgi:hypothetical protein
MQVVCVVQMLLLERPKHAELKETSINHILLHQVGIIQSTHYQHVLERGIICSNMKI